MKLILSLLLYINKYYENRIIKVKYLSSLLAITETTVSRKLKKLEELGYIKSELEAHKNKILEVFVKVNHINSNYDIIIIITKEGYYGGIY